MTKNKLTEEQILKVLSEPFTSIYHEELFMTDRIKQEILENFKRLGFVESES